MGTSTLRVAKVKPERKVRLETAADGTTVLVITIITRGPRIGVREEAYRYRLRSLDAGHGMAFRLDKLDHFQDGEPTNYDLSLDPDGITDPDGGAHSCECKGYLRWGHCKHVDSLLALIEAEIL